MNVLVVDDEEPARKRLIRLLTDVADVTVVGEANTGQSALLAIASLEPDVVLLDIEMPELDGLSMVTGTPGLPPVIFVTAHDRHAVPAFDVDAADYLLKPVRRERLLQALERAARRLPPRDSSGRNTAIVPRIVSFDRGITRLFDARKLTRLWAADKYTVFLGDGEERLTVEPLAALEKRLAPHGFVRVHRAELVRLSAVRSVGQRDGVAVVDLEDGQVARVSRRSVATLKTELGLG